MGCCKYTPSDLRHRIVFESLSLAANDSGGQDQSYSTFATVWAKIEPRIIKEVNFSQRIEPRTSHKIVIRYIAGLNTSMRISFDSRYFEIKAIIIVDEIKEWIEIAADERTGT